jgi:hypothetical protein
VSTTSTTLSNKHMNRRRSQRLMLTIRITVVGKRSGGQTFTEGTCTSVVNAHGALIALAEPVVAGQLLGIRNLLSEEERACKVVDLGAGQAGPNEVALEFLEPAPRFWKVTFPPDDWTPKSPDAKRYSTRQPAESKVD